jgi:hypothetical protein
VLLNEQNYQSSLFRDFAVQNVVSWRLTPTVVRSEIFSPQVGEAMLALALFGVAYTSIACNHPLARRRGQGAALAPYPNRGPSLDCGYRCDVMMNSDASALVLLTLLALGTFTAGDFGVKIRSSLASVARSWSFRAKVPAR